MICGRKVLEIVMISASSTEIYYVLAITFNPSFEECVYREVKTSQVWAGTMKQQIQAIADFVQDVARVQVSTWILTAMFNSSSRRSNKLKGAATCVLYVHPYRQKHLDSYIKWTNLFRKVHKLREQAMTQWINELSWQGGTCNELDSWNSWG